MPYFAECSFCPKKFKTGRSLSGHLVNRHPQLQHEKGEVYEPPQPHEISMERREEYLKWLSVLLERMNGSLQPDYPGELIHRFMAKLVSLTLQLAMYGHHEVFFIILVSYHVWHLTSFGIQLFQFKGRIHGYAHV